MTTQTLSPDALLAAGGSRWQKEAGSAGKAIDRIYFNDLGTLLGVVTHRYGTGNISSATLDGEKISNSDAREIVMRTENGKLWFDVLSGEWGWKELTPAEARTIIGRILERTPTPLPLEDL